MIALLLAAVAAAAPCAPARSAAPVGPHARLVVVESTFDAGTVDRGTKVVHAFGVRNTGVAPLTLDVKPHCGCTVADFDKIVAPGDTGTITLSIDTTRFKGPITKSATVTTNDPASTSIELSLSSTVRVPIDVTPSESVHLATAAPKQALTIRATAGPLKLEPLEVKGSFFRQELSAAAADGSRTLAVWLAPDAPKGMSRGSITLRASAPAGATMEIPVVARID